MASTTPKTILGLSSSNPLLANITDYLIEEASAEEEELLGRGDGNEEGEEGQQGVTIARDDELIKVGFGFCFKREGGRIVIERSK